MITLLFFPFFWFFGLTAKFTLLNLGVAAGAGILAGVTVGVGASFIYHKLKNDPGPLNLLHPYSDIATAYWTQSANGIHGFDETEAINGTRRLGVEKSLLYYQDPQGAVIVSSRSHADALWNTVNITHQLVRSGHPVTAKPGTPMAATASPGSPFEAVLYFLDTLNKTVEIRSKDHMLKSWVPSDLGNQTSLHVDPYSQLAAHWFTCLPDCRNSRDGMDQVRVFFQKSNKLNGAISAPWSQTGLNASITPGSAIATTPYVPLEGPVEMRLFAQNSSQLQMMAWRNETGWGLDEKFTALNQRGVFEGQSMAATSFPAAKSDPRPAWFLMVLQLQKKWSVKATYWDPLAGKWVANKGIKFRGRRRSRKFTRIALNHNGTFYGVVKGRVDEYNIDAEKPNQFTFSSRVALMNTLKDIDEDRKARAGRSG